MKAIVQFSEQEEAQALPVLLRHSPGMVLAGRIYVLSSEALVELRQEGIQYTEINRKVE